MRMRKNHIIKRIESIGKPAIIVYYITKCGQSLEFFENNDEQGYCKRCFVSLVNKENVNG